MIPASTFISSAKGRLLPPSIPFRFFAAAAVFHIAMWLVLAASAADLPGFAGGPGAVLAAVHLLTLGVLTMTVIGAALQLLSVATKRPIRSLPLARLISWLYIPGVAILAYGMAAPNPAAMTAGGAMVSLALLVFAGLVAENLAAAKGLGVTVAHCWGALIALVAVIALGLLLIGDYREGFLDDHVAVAVTHFILAAYAFIGLFVMGFSYLLIPMFAIARGPSELTGYLALTHAAMAVLFAVAGALLGISWLLALAAVAGLVAAATHLWGMVPVFVHRMRRRLGLPFILVRLGWAMLPVSLVLGFVLASGLLDWHGGPALFGIVVLGGWLLTFLFGILQRIMPFLATMYATDRDGRPLAPGELTARGPLLVHTVCHVAALTLLTVGVIIDNAAAVRIGASVGAVGAVAFAWFAAGVIRRLPRQPAPSPDAALGKSEP